MTPKRSTPGKVFLVGAGPGDPDLITVRGYELLMSCDALVYDSLAAPELIRSCPAELKFYAGKTSGGHAMTQEEINKLLVDLATKPGGPEKIVRLKGGDPYVFGRGGEEALACAAADVPFEVVPGVSAGIGAAAYAGVPVTHRGMTTGVALLTGHTMSGGAAKLPLRELARSGLTLVLYMGVKHLPEITSALLNHGLDPRTPAMVIQEGTTPGQRHVKAEVSKIADVAAANRIRPPAVTVIGKVVAISDRLEKQEPRPLAGKTVIFLRAETYNYPEAARLRSMGARVIDVPVIRCSARSNDPSVKKLLFDSSPDDHVVVTSEAGVSILLDLWSKLKTNKTGPTLLVSSHRFGTKAESQGWRVVAPLVPGRRNLIEAIRSIVSKSSKLYLARSSSADPDLARALDAEGFDIIPVALYDVLPVPLPKDVQEMLDKGRADAIVFPSPSAVKAAARAVPGLCSQKGRAVLIAAVGDTTARELRLCGVECDLAPDPPSMASLVDALAEILKSRPHL